MLPTTKKKQKSYLIGLFIMSGVPRLLEFWLRLFVPLLDTEPLDADNDADNPFIFWLWIFALAVADTIGDGCRGIDDCNGVDKPFCICVLITLLFFNDCVSIVALLLLTILFKLFDVEEESRLINELGMLMFRLTEGFTFTFRPISVWLGLISRVLEGKRIKITRNVH